MRINHIAINCLDIAEMKAFFIKYFDVHEGTEYRNPKTGLHSWMLLFTEGSTKLELMSWPDIVSGTFPPANPSSSAVPQHRQGLVHLSISVASKQCVDTLTAQLEADGYRRMSGPRTTGDGYYESCILGPENIEIEITV